VRSLVFSREGQRLFLSFWSSGREGESFDEH
jgi:hypothetical protein